MEIEAAIAGRSQIVLDLDQAPLLLLSPLATLLFMPPSSLPHSFLAFPLDQMPRITSRLIACRLIAMRVTPLPPLVNNLLTRVIWPPYLWEAFISPLPVTPLGTAERQKPVDIHLTGQLNVLEDCLGQAGRIGGQREKTLSFFSSLLGSPLSPFHR